MNRGFSLTCIALFLLTSLGYTQDYEYILKSTLAGHNAEVTSMVLRNEDNLLISGAENGEIFIWDVASASIHLRLNGHTDKVTDLAVSPSGVQVLSASYDGTCKLWDINTGQLLKSYDIDAIAPYQNVSGKEPTFARFTPDGASFYTGGYNMAVHKVDIASGVQNRVFRTRSGGITCGVISDDGHFLYVGVLGRIYVVNLQSKSIERSFGLSSNQGDFICELELVPEENTQLASWNYNGKIQFWNWQNGTAGRSMVATSQEGTSNMAFSEDGRWLLTGNNGNKTKLWDLQQERVHQTLKKHQSNVVCFAFSKDRQLIATGSQDRKINIWSVEQEFEQVSPPPPPPSTEPEEEVVTEPAIDPPADTTTDTDEPEDNYENRIVEVQATYSTPSPNVRISLNDNRTIDGDIISVSVNGVWILRRYTLERRKKHLSVPLIEGENLIMIYAHNEGSISPNTIGVDIEGENFSERRVFKSSLNTTAGIKIFHQPN
jgi:WD40 repeat protein